MNELIALPVRRIGRLLCLVAAFIAPAAWADSLRDYQDDSARFRALASAAMEQGRMPRMYDPDVAALFARLTDGQIFYQASDTALKNVAQSTAICDQVNDLAKMYYDFHVKHPRPFAGTQPEQLQAALLEDFGDEISAFIAFGLHCNAHLIGLMEAEFVPRQTQEMSVSQSLRVRDFVKSSIVAYSGVVQSVNGPHWNVQQKKVLLEAAAEHAVAHARLIPPFLRQFLLNSIAGADADLDPSLAAALLIIRRPLAMTECVGLCELF